MNLPFDLLLGRRTFDIWAQFWPQHSEVWPAVNTASKYVASNTMPSVQAQSQPEVYKRSRRVGQLTAGPWCEAPTCRWHRSGISTIASFTIAPSARAEGAKDLRVYGAGVKLKLRTNM
jgi:hypothetical protein